VEKRTHLTVVSSGEHQLQSGGGGGTFDGMEARVAKLEADIEYIKRDVGELRTDMKDVRERTIKIEGSMATKAFVFTVYGIVSVFLAAITLFQSQILTLLGIAPSH
jgi:hypothetical protein